jgi:hypothetical protein
MPKGKLRILLSLVIIAAIIITIIRDLMYLFGNYDTPFIVVFILFTALMYLLRLSSKVTFYIVLLFIVFMGNFYIQYGPIRITERSGEWFYLFFVFGLLQYIREAWRLK